jgi:iron complex outermembrane recepter protein
MSNAVAGTFEPTDALRRILARTGWTFSSIVDDRVSIMRDRRAPAPRSADIPPPKVPLRDNIAFDRSSESIPEFGLLPVSIEQVLVTGSLIRGVDAITSPLISLVSGQIPDTGYAGAGAQNIIDNTLPIASNDTPREDRPVTGNFGFGLGINLRGLGVGATLVLVDGRRQPLAGLNGAFVDVSAVPDAAIDRIEVIPDGASALYGSDAIAGVVNIILRHDVVGVGNEVLASQIFGSKWDGGRAMFLYQYTDRTAVPIASRSYAANPDKRPQGGDDFSSVDANPGNILDPTTGLPAFAIPPGQNGRTLSVNQLLPGKVNYQNPWLGYDLYPQRTTHSFYVTAEQELSPALTGFFDGRLDLREDRLEDQARAETLTVPSSNAFFVDPFGQTPYVNVGYSFLDDLGNVYWNGRTVGATASLGLKIKLPGEWQSVVSLSDGIEAMDVDIFNEINPTALSAALADSNKATAFNPFGAGSNTSAATLSKIRAIEGEQAWSRLPDLNAVADGPLFTWKGTSAKLAVGLDLRQETLQQHQTITNYTDVRTAYRREISSFYSELALSFPHHIELSVAGRYEHYSDFGSTTNPKVGIRWSPSPGIKLRASWGTSFRAPDLPNLDTSNNSAGLVRLPDPKSPSGQSMVLYEEGNSPTLHQENASTWTLGLDLAPAIIPGLQTSLTYYSIDYRDRIAQPGPANVFNFLQDETQWSQVIQRDPPTATVLAICNGPRFFSSPAACLSTPPAAIVDLRLRNLSRTLTKGIDLNLEQAFATRMGFFRWNVRGTYLLTFGQAVSEDAPVTSVVNTLSYPIRTKARATAGWSERGAKLPGLSFLLAANFAGAYVDNESVPSRRIDSYSTLEAQLGYSTGKGHRWYENTDITLSVTNLLNANPPFVNTQLGFDQPNTPPFARLVNLSVKKKW